MMLAESLTDREREILALIAGGHTNREIAARLFLTYRTVKWYNTQIFSKLGVSNREQAIEQAQALGLLDAPGDDLFESPTRHNLPHQTTPFIGRRGELADLARLIADPDTPLVTILAPGGMGKTRLGLAAAEGQLRHFSDGVFFVPLAPLSNHDDIVTTIAENAGFSFYGSDPPKQQLLDYFRGRHTLLVLDNFEHLLEGAPLVSDILQAAPLVKVLATSREKLNLSGETVFTLSGLEFPTWETPDDALEYDAVKLFMQSAHRVRPDFELQTDDLDYLARICRLTTGMPLGIVLAAGWLDVLSLEQITAEIQKGIDILETEQRDVPERQRSVRATFEQTWNRLTEAERDAFMKLSVFRGGFTSEAAGAVAGADMRILRRLANKALVQVMSTERYGVHELLRQYAEEKLRGVGEAEAVQQAHSIYYMDFMAKRDEDVKGRKQQAGLQEIRDDFENIRQGWLWAAEHHLYDAISVAALECLVNFAEMNFSTLEVQAILDQTIFAVQSEGEEPPHQVWDQTAVRRERINLMLGDPVDPENLETIMARARERGDRHGVAYCLWTLADCAFVAGDYGAHLAYFEECLPLWQSVGDAFYIAHAFVGISGGYIGHQQIERGLESLRQSARIEREIGDQFNLCLSLSHLAGYLTWIGEFAEAEALLDETLLIQAEIGKGPVYAFIVGNKAILAFWRGEFDTAVHHVQAWEDFAGERDYMGMRSFSHAFLGWVASVGGDYERGYALCQQAASRKLAFAPVAWIQWGLALANCGLGNDGAARRSLAKTLNVTLEVKAHSVKQFCLPLAAVLVARAGSAERAVELLGLAYSAPKELTGWMAHWQLLVDLRRDLEAELGAEVYATAWERGSQLDLKPVVDELLVAFADPEGK